MVPPSITLSYGTKRLLDSRAVVNIKTICTIIANNKTMWIVSCIDTNNFIMTNEKTRISIVLSTNIKTVRKQKNITQEQLSEMVGVTVGHISLIERGLAYPSSDKVDLIANALGVPTYKLFIPEEVESSTDESYVLKDVLKDELKTAINHIIDEA